MKKTLSSRVILIGLFLVGITLLFTNVPIAYGQTQPTVVPATPTVEKTETAVPPSQQQIDDLLKTYQEVLASSKSAVEEVHTTANNVLDLVGKMFTALTIVGIAGTGLFTYLGQRASDKANAAQQKATEALDNLQRLDAKAIELERRNTSAIESTNELTHKQNNLRSQIDAAEKLLRSLQAEFTQLKSSGENDRQVIKKPLALVQVDEYGMQALSGSPMEKSNSILALIEMSNRSDAVVQRRAVKALGILDEYDERVVKRLKDIIESDVAQGVRKEAEKSLKFIESKKPKKTPRRKA